MCISIMLIFDLAEHIISAARHSVTMLRTSIATPDERSPQVSLSVGAAISVGTAAPQASPMIVLAECPFAEYSRRPMKRLCPRPVMVS